MSVVYSLFQSDLGGSDIWNLIFDIPTLIWGWMLLFHGRWRRFGGSKDAAARAFRKCTPMYIALWSMQTKHVLLSRRAFQCRVPFRGGKNVCIAWEPFNTARGLAGHRSSDGLTNLASMSLWLWGRERACNGPGGRAVVVGAVVEAVGLRKKWYGRDPRWQWWGRRVGGAGGPRVLWTLGTRKMWPGMSTSLAASMSWFWIRSRELAEQRASALNSEFVDVYSAFCIQAGRSSRLVVHPCGDRTNEWRGWGLKKIAAPPTSWF